jgi:NAD(P)-dependent dehydrogenase (short-subunit alcohol dehydrogenase family)
MTNVWLVTGSSRGLGRDITLAALAAGHRVVATARRPEQLAALKAQYGDQVRTVALDVTDEAAAHAAVAAAVEAFGRLDVVVNNAGYGNLGAVEELPADDFRAQVETNFFGVVHVTRAALPVLRRQRRGHIVQIASIGGRIGTPGLSAYQAAKWAVEGFSEALAQEVEPLGIKVTIVEPGGFRTDWAGSSMAIAPIGEDYQSTVGAKAAYARTNTGGERGDPARAAQAILRVVAHERPPLRLLLGSDAVFVAESVAARRAREDAAWKELSLSTDFPGSVDVRATPVAAMTRP